MRFTGIVLRAAFLAALLTSPPIVWACSVCGSGDPLLVASDPAAIMGQLRVQIDTEYLRVEAGTAGEPGSTDELTQWTYRFNAVYRPFERLSLMATLPLVGKSIHMKGDGMDMVMSDLHRLGDVEVAARYAVARRVAPGTGRIHEVAVTAGTALPTGSHDAKADDGSLIDPHGQVGTGAWSPFAGVSYRFEQGRWLAFASLSGRLRTEARYFDGTRYKFGDAVLWSVHAQHRPVGRIALDLGIDGRYARADEAAGDSPAAVANTGGTVLSLAPGVYVNAASRLWLFVRAQIPFHEDLLGDQDVLPTLTAGVQFQVL